MDGIEQYTHYTGVTTSHRYKTGIGEISLLKPSYTTMDSFEIYCIKGCLFSDIERFDTLDEAEARIKELLLPTT